MGKRSETPNYERLQELNTLCKMFDVDAVCYFDQGRPKIEYAWHSLRGSVARRWPFRIDCMNGRGWPIAGSKNYHHLGGGWEGQMRTQWMFSTLAELEDKVHELISEKQGA